MPGTYVTCQHSGNTIGVVVITVQQAQEQTVKYPIQ